MNGNVFCTQCGATLAAGARFCNHCGAAQSALASTAVPPVTPTPAFAAPVAATSYPPVTSYGVVAPVARYGGFWVRFIAVIIDAIIVDVVVMPLSFMVGGFSGIAGSMSGISHEGLPILGGLLGFGIGVFGSWLYEAFMESSSHQATLGKMIFGMKVTDLNGNRISFERATGRHFAKYLSGLILLIGYIMAGFTERKQALHDMLAGTLVRRY